MKDLPSLRTTQEYSTLTTKETLAPYLKCGHLPPKAFYKTHHFFRWDLGYWRMPARHGSIFSILFLVTFLPGYYSQYGFRVIKNDSISPFGFDCMSSSGWSFVGSDLIPFGKFSFGEAKAIDLAWNWVIGRGLQGILTLLAYRVFSDALLRVVELTAVPFELYVALALPATKIELLWQVCRNLVRRGNWRVKMIFFWLVISTIYLIAVPGLMDAATAYESSYEIRFLWLSSQKSQPVDDINEWLSDPSIVTVTDSVCLRFYTTTRVRERIPLSSLQSQNITLTDFTILPSLPANSSNVAVSKYGSCQNVTAQGEGWLVHTSFGVLYDWKDTVINETWRRKLEEKPLDAMVTYAWDSWDFQPTNRSSFQCIVEAGAYLWGFSFEWLFLITIINSVWLWGLWILWLDCDTNSEFCRKRRRLGTYRAIMDLSEAIREELGPNICAYSDTEC